MISLENLRKEISNFRIDSNQILGIDVLDVLHNIGRTHYYCEMKYETYNEKQLLIMLAKSGFIYNNEDDIVLMTAALESFIPNNKDKNDCCVFTHIKTGLSVVYWKTVNPSKSIWSRDL